ncbi:MAG: hypothetical protein JSV30_00140 [Candidatus Omnitrophota bacterium]|nr:MAG: hypothetical protein JSV30_00140 [Candidatus Omnitrophota bacterium]
MVPTEALKLALSKEEQSIELYQRLSANHPELKDLLSDLLTEEQKHKKLIEEKLADLMR